MKRNKGITLIALVITIIVLLILAGITIAALSGENGILTRAKEARDKAEIAVIEEQIELAKMSSLDDNGEIVKQTLKIELGKIDGIDNIIDKVNGVQVEYKGKSQFIQTGNGKIELAEDELEDIAEDIIAGQEEQDYVIGIDVYGNQVDLANWNYVFHNADLLLMYTGNIENETIIGEIPAYIIKSESGIVTKGAVTVLEGTFSNKTDLKTINVAFPKTVTYYSYAFANSGITSIPPKINLDSVQYLSSMFQNCTGLTEIPSTFNLANASNLTNCSYMFQDCTNLTTIPEGFAIPSSMNSVEGMFYNTKITTIPKSLNLENATNLQRCDDMFEGCTNLTTIPEGFAIPSSVTNVSDMFKNTKITKIPDSLNLKNLNNLVHCMYMFQQSSLEELPVDFGIGPNVTSASFMFAQTKLKSLPQNFNLESLTKLKDCSWMFQSTQISALPDGFALPDSVTNCSGMFGSCTKLESIPDTFKLGDNMETCHKLFEKCSSLTYIPSDFRIPPKITNIDSMFQDVKNANINNLIIPEGVTNITEAFASAGIQGTITIEGNPTQYTSAFSNTAQNAPQPLTVNYTSKCTNIEEIKATATENAKIEFKLVQ